MEICGVQSPNKWYQSHAPKLAKWMNPRNAERRWWAPVISRWDPWMSLVRQAVCSGFFMDVSWSQHGEEELTWDRASSRGRWCFHVRRVLPTHWSGESWLVESGRMDNHLRGGSMALGRESWLVESGQMDNCLRGGSMVLCSRGGLLGIRPKSHID